MHNRLSAAAVPGGWSQMILEVKMWRVLGWCGYTWSALVRPVGCKAKLSEMPLETAYGREINIQFTGNSSGGHSCGQHANCTLPQTCNILALCCVIKLRILECPFIGASLRHTCAIIMLSNQHLVMLYLWLRWMDYLGKGEVPTNTDLEDLWTIFERNRPFVFIWKSLRSLSSAHAKWGQKQKCYVIQNRCPALQYFAVMVYDYNEL